MEAIFQVVAALAKAIGYILQFVFEAISEIVCLPMMIVVFITCIHARQIKIDYDRWERRASVAAAFFHLIFDLCVFLPS
jgi:hypothetical protein